jgi:hypothetical protein
MRRDQRAELQALANTFATLSSAKAEAEEVFCGGEGMYRQYVVQRSSGTYYIASERIDVPYEGTPVAVIGSDGWVDLHAS